MYGLRHTHIRIKDQQLDFRIDTMICNYQEIGFINKDKGFIILYTYASFMRMIFTYPQP